MLNKEIQENVVKFLKYLKLREENGYALTDEEKTNIYPIYVEYCQSTGLISMKQRQFHTFLGKMGVQSHVVYDANLKKAVRIRDVSAHNLYSILETQLKDYAFHEGVVEIGGKRYQIIIKLALLNNEEQKTEGDPTPEV